MILSASGLSLEAAAAVTSYGSFWSCLEDEEKEDRSAKPIALDATTAELTPIAVGMVVTSARRPSPTGMLFHTIRQSINSTVD
jgi:hypothetical protein